MKAKVNSTNEIRTSATGWSTVKVKLQFDDVEKEGNVFLGKNISQLPFKVGEEIDVEEKEGQYGLEFKLIKQQASGGGGKPMGQSFKESREDWVMKNKSIIAQSSMSTAVEYLKYKPQSEVNAKLLIDVANVIYNFVLEKSELK